jgi:LuxR family maltose regulon positive regulatory protein
VDEGLPLARLLYRAAEQTSTPTGAYIGQLLAAFPPALEPSEQAKHQRLKTELIEPLSEREIEILRLIAAGLSNQKIAGQLILSLNTIKTHTGNIYAKLSVNSRAQAIAKARALDIL